MKKKICFGVFAVLLGVLLGLEAHFLNQKYIDSSLIFEKNYKKNPTTLNLVKLCDHYTDNNDMKYLQYIDYLLNAEDYDTIVGEYYDISLENIDELKNVQIMATMYVCAANNNIDEFVNAMKKYYVQLETANKPYYFYTVIVKLDTSFVSDNREIIVSTLYNMSQSQDAPLMKLRELMFVLAYYNVADKDNDMRNSVKDEIDLICTQLDYGDDILEKLSSITKEYENYWLGLLV